MSSFAQAPLSSLGLCKKKSQFFCGPTRPQISCPHFLWLYSLSHSPCFNRPDLLPGSCTLIWEDLPQMLLGLSLLPLTSFHSDVLWACGFPENTGLADCLHPSK